MKRPSVAIVHPQIRWGGGEAVAFWAIQALKDDYDVTLITFDNVNLSQVNKFYGVDFRSNDFKILQMPLPASLRGTQKAWLLKQHLAMRYVKKVRARFDLMFGTFNEMDFGKPGIQYIHFPVLAEDSLKALGFIDFEGKWYYKNTLFRKAYKRLCIALSGFSTESMRRNVTLVNSRWTGKIVEKIYDIRPHVVYPPVKSDFPSVPWEDREEGFVCLGRISPEKRIEVIIEIIDEVRKSGHDVHLHIIGRTDESDYSERIRKLVDRNKVWINLEEGISRERLVQLLTHHKFGIHGMKNEHFGIAVAEMVKAGMIVFVPNDGGQTEIVDHPVLTFNSEQEAVEKIVRVFGDRNLQADLREHLKQRASLFSAQRFMSDIKAIVGKAIQRGQR